MWHRRRRRRLGVKTKHRKALLRNLVRGLAFHRQIITTYARAKEASRLADQMVTLAKGGNLAARRELIRYLGSPEVAKVFIEQIAPRLAGRLGGYTRVLKMNHRPGDNAAKALLEFSVPIETPEKKEKKGKKAKKEKIRPSAEKPSAPKLKEEKKEPKSEEKKKIEKPAEKKETEKRGGFLARLRKFLTGDENS